MKDELEELSDDDISKKINPDIDDQDELTRLLDTFPDINEDNDPEEIEFHD